MDEPAKVLSLIQPTGPIDETMIPALEGLLEAAKRGEVACVAYATVLRDGSIQSAMSPPHQHVFTMLGAIERLKLRFHALHVMEPGE
jgi:hypothetical protein